MKRWTKEEEDIIIKNYRNMSLLKLKNLFQDRSLSAIRKRAYYLKIRRYKIFNWTNQEDQVLKENYQKKTLIEIKGLLNNRSVTSIKQRASKLKITRSY